ncbi:autotransporter assembly complex family protein [Pelomonas sp. KK5]|uniref:autotransporter assembly complex protein TamA n=1 Tax=Pelomonas sp. KK5 TaxID=1855730 RepID=UPI00097CB5F5|nr:BamA/TamA family outer membrane protein [Pelomonas sp. KK5]
MIRRAGVLLVLLALGGCASVTSYFSGASDAKAEKPVGPVEAAASAPRMVAAYTLEVKAPAALRTLLMEHLDLSRFQRTDEADRLSRVELDRLAGATPNQARTLLETAGYFNAHIKLERTPATAAVAERIVVEVEPGPQARVTEVALDFSGELAAADAATQRQLHRAWALDRNEPFSQSAWSSAKSALLVRIRAAGYPLAEWTKTEAKVEADENRVSLALALDSGPLYHLGSLTIEGLKYQDEATIRRLAGFQPGEPYSEQRLQEFQERLLKTQLFDTVSVDIQPEAGKPEAAAGTPVIVRVREAARQQATTGIGYDANTGQRVTLEYLNRVPFGLPLRARSKLVLGRDLKSGEFEVSSHPQANMSRNLASLQLEHDTSADQDTTNLSARIGRLRETRDDDRLVYAEWLRSRERQADANGDPYYVTGSALSANVQWTRRRLDSLLLPTNGHAGQLLLGAGRADNSISDSGFFGKVWFKGYGYKRLSRDWFGNVRLELGQVLAANSVGIPDKLLFKAGGDDSVRGYAYQSLGPQTNGVVVGGRVVGTGSVEVGHPFLKNMPDLWGVVFVDGGNAAPDWGHYKPVWGAGFGVHWRSPVGPLRIDIARGIEAKRWRLHFSVGIAL